MDFLNAKNDIQLLDCLRRSGGGLEILGVGFKVEDTFTAQGVNTRLAEQIKDKRAVFYPSMDDAGMYWVAICN